MKATYDVKMIDGRCYFHDGSKYVLVDTGYGDTVSEDGFIGVFDYINMCNAIELKRFNPTLMPDGSKIGAILCPNDGYSCLITKNTITIDDQADIIPTCKWFIPFEFGGKYPVVKCSVDGKDKLLFFDSGMRLPVLDDDSLIKDKKTIKTQLEWIGVLSGLAEAPVYEASFDFACGFHYNGHMEHDYVHSYIRNMFAGTDINGYLGFEFLNDYDMFISEIEGNKGIALIERNVE